MDAHMNKNWITVICDRKDIPFRPGGNIVVDLEGGSL